MKKYTFAFAVATGLFAIAPLVAPTVSLAAAGPATAAETTSSDSLLPYSPSYPTSNTNTSNAGKVTTNAPAASADTLFGLKDTILTLINDVFVPLLFAIAFLVFIFGVYKHFIQNGASGDEKNEGKKLILYGLIGFAVMVSVWGLVNIVTGTFGLDSGGRPDYPTL